MRISDLVRVWGNLGGGHLTEKTCAIHPPIPDSAKIAALAEMCAPTQRDRNYLGMIDCITPGSGNLALRSTLLTDRLKATQSRSTTSNIPARPNRHNFTPSITRLTRFHR